MIVSPMNQDLIPRSPETRRNALDMDRAFTQSQLVILRERDKFTDRPQYELLDKIADEIHSLAREWHKFNTDETR